MNNNLKDFRLIVRDLNRTCLKDLKTFTQNDKITFRRLPRKPKDEVNVATACTVLMALATNGYLESFYKKSANSCDAFVKDVFKSILENPWESSGLPDGNPFTVALVLRTASVLTDCLGDDDRVFLQCKKLKGAFDGLTLQDVIRDISNVKDVAIPAKFKVVDALTENPALAYWILDAIERLKYPLNEIDQEFWFQIATWVSTEFLRQFSLISAKHGVMMDPVAMALAACAIKRLRKICNTKDFTAKDYIDNTPFGHKVKVKLPSDQELSLGLKSFFELQQPSGIWDKYFPIFYYTKEREGGANYCFAFELLEAVLNEFGKEVVECPETFEGLKRAVEWCSDNRLSYWFEDQNYEGWNSGQQVDSLSSGEPESWATATVHMFLKQLETDLTKSIQSNILKSYDLSEKTAPRPDSNCKAWKELLDIEIPQLAGNGGENKKLKNLLETCMIGPALKKSEELSDVKRSALLFGPPGTGKSTIAKMVAKRLDWHFVEISPSHFLDQGLEKIYVRASEIFDNLKELKHTVVLFDEMDALVQRRDGDTSRLDVTQQFLTTSMLPKLSKLHDQAQLIFFMATNYRKDFDAAIIRPGRFDLLLCIGPPSFEEKMERIEHFLPKKFQKETIAKTESDPSAELISAARCREAKELFEKIAKSNNDRETLSLTTRGEFIQLCNSLFSKFAYKDELRVDLDEMREKVQRLEVFMTLRRSNDNPTWMDFEKDKLQSRIQ